MAGNTSDPCLYFARSWRNGRVTDWKPMPDPIQDHRINTPDLHRLVGSLPHNNNAPSYWKNNYTYQAGMMGAGGSQPVQTYAVIKLPVRLVANLTDWQALNLVEEIDSYVMQNLAWSSTDRHSLATINHLPTTETGAGGFYRKGGLFFRKIQRWIAGNVPSSTLGAKFGLGAQQIAQPAKPTAAPPSPPKKAASSPPPPPPPSAPAPQTHRPSRNFQLHRRLGIKGTQPSPDALKQLRRIWNAQKTNADAAQPTQDDAAQPPAPPPSEKPPETN